MGMFDSVRTAMMFRLFFTEFVGIYFLCGGTNDPSAPTVQHSNNFVLTTNILCVLFTSGRSSVFTLRLLGPFASK